MANGTKVYPSLPFEFPNAGLLPGAAQAAQATPWVDPQLNPQPYFNTDQLAHALWYTTRVHLAPIGRT